MLILTTVATYLTSKSTILLIGGCTKTIFSTKFGQQSGRRWGFSLPEPAVAENTWEHGDVHTFGGMEFEILHTRVTHWRMLFEANGK